VHIDNHPTREQLIEVAAFGETPFDEHLAHCPSCRMLLALLRRFPFAGEPKLHSAPVEWIRRAEAIAERPKAAVIRRLIGKLTFDSWAGPAALQVRGAADDERRVRIEAEEIRFDLRAERRNDGWRFVARVVGERPASAVLSLRASHQTVFPDEHGYFVWSDSTPPDHLLLDSSSFQIEVTDLSWTRPST
jgi:hypothetical protein